MTDKHYAIFHPSEDGRPFSVLTPAELKEFLENPKEHSGVQRFKNVAMLKEDPNYWKEGDGVLICFEIVTPRKTDGWIL